MRRSLHSHTPIAALESRELLSGNVAFQLNGSTLRITGDNSSNEVSIRQSTGGMIISAVNGTKLNGVTNGTQTIANPSSIVIDLKGGNDILNLQDFLGGQVNVQLGSGNDKLNANSVVCDGSFLVDLGSGNDLLNATGTVETPNQFGGAFEIKGNSGNDKVLIDQFVVNGKSKFDMGNGNDALGLAHGLLNDTLNIDLGNSSDILGILSLRANSTTGVLGNTGDDIVGITQSRFVQNFTVDLGEGKDALLTQNNEFDANVSRVGGNATDVSYKSGDLILGTESITGFEVQTTTITPQITALYNKLASVLPV